MAGARLEGDRRRPEASTDPLTGLRNRRGLVGDLERRCRDADRERPSTVMLFDLDGLKRYNDTFGHQAGDALLTELSRRVSEAVAPFAIVYRIGGDEFCLLSEDWTATPEAVMSRATRALTRACAGLPIIASAGSAVIGVEAHTASEALRLADERMCSHKRHGRADGSLPHLATALLSAFEGRDGAWDSHSTRTASLAAAVAAQLDLSPDQIERVRLASMLHDIGKVALPYSILAKPGTLDEREWEFMRRHPVIGPGCSRRRRCSSTSPHPYRDAVSSHAALAELRRCARPPGCDERSAPGRRRRAGAG